MQQPLWVVCEPRSARQHLGDWSDS